MKNAALLVIIMLAAASSQLSAYGLTVKVTLSQGTLAFGTNVTLERGGVAVANAIADSDGTAAFNVTAGSYFVRLDRYSFPASVSLVDVEKDTLLEYTLWQGMTYSNAYGYISGASDFSNSSVTAYSGSQVAKRVTHAKNGYPDSNGYFMLPFLPEGNYRLVFDVPGYQEAEEDVFLPNAQFVEVNPALAPAVQQAPVQPALSAPASVQQYSMVVATLSQAGAPMAGQGVSVQTPSGNLSLTTSSDGTVSVNGAEAGQYVFSFGNLTASTAVQGNQTQPAQQGQQQATQPEQQPAQNSSSQQPAQQPPGQNNDILPLLAVGGLSIIVIAAAAALFFIVSRYGKEKGGAGGSGAGGYHANSSQAHGHLHSGNAHEHRQAQHPGHHHEEQGQKGRLGG